MDRAEEKENLRKKLLEERRRIEKDQYLHKSATIKTKLKTQPEFQQAGLINCYVSMVERREVDTRSFIRDILESDKQISVPVTNFESGELKHIYLEDFEELKENKWGVMEPAAGKEAVPTDFELVIVPMVGGDLDRNRIGYGKGFYDRFLAKVNCPTIGLLFERCLVKKVPIEKFDIPLDKIITEARIISKP